MTNGYMAVGADGFGRMVVSNGTVLATEIRLGTNSTGRGELEIVGGTVTILSGTSDGLRVGDFAGATGTVVIADGELAVTNTATLIGSAGFGEMFVSSGTVMTAETEIGSGTNAIGSLKLTGGTMTIVSKLTVAASPGSFGVVEMIDGELVVTNAPLVIGQNGGAGDLMQTAPEVPLRPESVVERIQPLAGGGGSVLRLQNVIVADDGSVGTLSTLSGTNFVSSDVVVGVSSTSTGTVVVGSYMQVGGDFILGHNPRLEFQLSGYEAGTEAGLITVSNTANFAGTFAVRLIGDFAGTITNGASFTVLTAKTITGAFANVSSGQRLTTENDEGSFRVNYSGNELVLEDFQHGEEPPQMQDLALVAIKVPKRVMLKSDEVVKRVKVQIQNRGTQAQQIDSLAGLVTLAAESINGDCPDAVVVLHPGKPNKPLPFLLKAGKKLNVIFDVTFDCANDGRKGAGFEDYRYLATVHALNGKVDIVPSNDDCPRFPAGTDTGCAEVLTDVIVK